MADNPFLPLSEWGKWRKGKCRYCGGRFEYLSPYAADTEYCGLCPIQPITSVTIAKGKRKRANRNKKTA